MRYTKKELLETAEQAAQERAAELKQPPAAKLDALITRETARAVEAIAADLTLTVKDRAALGDRFAAVLRAELSRAAASAKVAPRPTGKGGVTLKIVARGRTAPLFGELVKADNDRYALFQKLAKGSQRPRLTRTTPRGWVAFVIDSSGVGVLASCDAARARAIKPVKLVEPSLAVSPDFSRCFVQSKGQLSAVELPGGTEKKLALPRDLKLECAVSPTELVGFRDEGLEWWSIDGKPTRLARLDAAEGYLTQLSGALVFHGLDGLALIARREAQIVKLASLAVKDALSVQVTEAERVLLRLADVVVEVSGLSEANPVSPIANGAAAFRR